MNSIAFQLPAYSPLIAALILFSALYFLRKPGRGGSLGNRIRNSDWWAWRDAMNDKQRELDELRAAEPHGSEAQKANSVLEGRKRYEASR
jgi:hypothetical protein